jgi:microcystin-dependent protein
MSSTYSTSLKLELIGNGDQSGTWGNTTNNNLGTLLEQAITGVQNITMSNADYTLSNYNGTSDEARNAVLVASGTNSAIRKIVAPQNQNKTYIISNQTSGGYSIIIGAPTGTAVTIPSGVVAQVYTDGANFYSSQTGSAGNFTVNGTLTATGFTDAGNMSVGGNLTVTGTTILSGTATATTPTTGDNSTQIATTAFVANSNPAISGQILMWPTGSAPSGYLLCDGTAVSRTTYATLFGVIGTTFGAGDTTTTFNLPNYTNRMPIGVGSTAALAATGGSKDAIVVSHTHTINDPSHNHTIPMQNGYVTYGGGPVIGGSGVDYYSNQAYTGISVNTAGVSGTNANLPPYLGINFIIKT